MKRLLLIPLIVAFWFLLVGCGNNDNPIYHPPVYAVPLDWEDVAYLHLYPDVAAYPQYRANPLAHWIECGESEGRIWKPVGWSSAEYLRLNPDVALAGDPPLLHYWMWGQGEGRIYKVWTPPSTPGLHLIIDQPGSGREIFAVIRTAEGLLLGDYGLGVGGPTVTTWNGKKFTLDAQFPEAESVFDFYLPDDGQMLLTNEHYGTIRKRTGEKTWEVKYEMGSYKDLTFYIRKAGNNLYANHYRYGTSTGGVLRGDLSGNNWADASTYTDKSLPGMTVDEGNIYLAGATGAWTGAGYPILTDINGNILSARPDSPRYKYWGVAKFKELFLLGTASYVSSGGTATDSHIDVFDGVQNTTVWTNERTVIHKIEVFEDRVYAVVTWDWDADSDKTTLLMSSTDGYKWNLEAEIPCPHIIGTRFADEGIYLSGGRYQDYGRVFFYKF